MEFDESICLFIGVPVSMRTLKAVANAASELQEKSSDSPMEWRWTAPARYHLTLCYLGWTKASVIPAVRDAVAKALTGRKAFDMRCRELGAFPSLEKAEVLWAGVDDRMGDLASLAKVVGEAMGELGFPMAEKPFHPHVTMARLGGPEDLVSLVQSCPERMFSKSWVNSLILYKSAVESNSSEYEKITSWPLK